MTALFVLIAAFQPLHLFPFQLTYNVLIPAYCVRDQAVSAVLLAGTGVFEVSTAVFSQREQRTKAEQAVETFGVCVGMTGIILTFPVCKVAVIVLFHGLISLLALDDACVKKCRL